MQVEIVTERFNSCLTDQDFLTFSANGHHLTLVERVTDLIVV